MEGNCFYCETPFFFLLVDLSRRRSSVTKTLVVCPPLAWVALPLPVPLNTLRRCLGIMFPKHRQADSVEYGRCRP